MVYTGAGVVDLTGNFGSGGTLTTVAGSILNFNGSGGQTAASYTTYGVVKVNNAAGLTMLGTSTIATLTIGDVTASSVFSDGGFQVTSTGTLNLTSGNFKLGSATAATTFPAFATRNINAGTTVEYASGIAQTVSATPSYQNLTLSGAGNKTAAAGLTVNGNFTTAAGTFTAGTFTHSVGGDWSNSGTFTANTGTVTMNGTGAQTLGGTAATTFNNLTIDKASNNVSVACATPSPTVSATLALTSGRIITAGTSPGCATTCSTQVPIIVAAAGTITGGGGTSYVQGALRKLFSAGATLNFRAAAGQDEFPVGDASNYTPVEITAGTTSTAGNITACVTPTEHPQVTTPPVASGGIDAAKSVNRYWSLATSTINTTAVLVNAIFKFVAGDVDAGAATGNFIVEDWNATSWSPTALVAAGAGSTQAGNIDLTGATNEFAIGEPLSGITSVPGRYNAFETSTPAGILGLIQTKIAGIGFSVDIVHINATKTGVLAGAITVEVRLLDSSGGGALDADGCNAAWPLIQALPNFAIPASGRGTIPAATEPNSYSSVRFQIRSPVGGPYTEIGCSTDLFAIRPQSLTITALDQDWQSAGTARALANLGASGGNVHKASAAATPLAFTLRAAPVPAGATNYNGSPTTASGFPDCTALGALCTSPGTLSFTAGSWATVGGVRENATAAYSEAGAFNLQLEDTIYANVDVVDGTPAAARTVPATASAQIGRFVPDHFDVTTLVAPAFRTFNAADAACSAGTAPRRTFTYIGQPFGYLTTPQATVLARNAGGATTTNYAGTLWKIGGATPSTAKDCTTDPNICQFTTSWSAGGNSSNVIESYTYALIPVSTPNWDDAGATPVAATVTAGTGVDAGTGIITYASSDTLAFLRNTTTAQAPFTASITNTISVQDTSEADGAIATTTAAAFGGITFDSGDAFRFGRLRLSNALGTELLGLPVRIETQYWNGTAFATNIDDHCTNLTPANITLGNYQYNGGVAWTTGVSFTGPFSAGLGDLKLSKPSPAPTRKGSVDVTVDLAAESKIYLQGAWTGTPYTQNPTARATFGVYKGANEFIYMREMY